MYYERRVTPVIILDEIHMASNKLLEDLRLIFNFNMDSESPSAIEAIYGVTSGVPRLINSLATNSLLVACEKKQRLIDEETVYQAQSELNF